jgi:hypothetical protein
MPNAIALQSIQFNTAVWCWAGTGGTRWPNWAIHGAALNALSFIPLDSLLLLTVRFLPESHGNQLDA